MVEASSSITRNFHVPAFQVVVGQSTAAAVHKAAGVSVVTFVERPPPPLGAMGAWWKHSLMLDNAISAHLMVAAIEHMFCICESLDGDNSVIPAIKVTIHLSYSTCHPTDVLYPRKPGWR